MKHFTISGEASNLEGMADGRGGLTHVLAAMLSLITTLVLCSSPVVASDILDCFGVQNQGFFCLMIATFCFLLYLRSVFGKPFGFAAGCLAILFGLFTVFGESFYLYEDWRLVFSGKIQICWSALKILGYSTLYYGFLNEIFIKLDNLVLGGGCCSDGGRKKSNWFSRHYGISCFFLFLLVWTALAIVYLPGSIYWDGIRQLAVYYGFRPLTNHDPILMTWLYGILMDVGRSLFGSDSAGLILIVFSQILVCSLIVALVAVRLRSVSSSRLASILFPVWFCLNPVVVCYAGTAVKDVVSAALFLLFVSLIYCIWRESGSLNGSTLALLFIVSFLLSLTRNNCIYVVIIALAIASGAFSRCRKRLAFCSIALLILFTMWNNCLLPFAGVSAGQVSEALSIPFQQTARYVATCPEDVSAEEEAALDRVFVYGEIADAYDSQTSDYVRQHLRADIDGSDYLAYFKAWFSMFIKHPNVYLEATMAHTELYWYPGVSPAFDHNYLNARSQRILDTTDLDLPFFFDEDFRLAIKEFFDNFIYLPVVGLLQMAGFYNWFLFAAVGYVCHRRKYSALVVLLPLLLTFFVCLASPLNGSIRYELPIIYSFPLIVAVIEDVAKKSEWNCKGSEISATSA